MTWQETDPVRIEVCSRILAVRMRCAMQQFRIGMFRRIGDAEAWALSSVSKRDVDMALEGLAKRISDCVRMIDILETSGSDASSVRESLAEWSSIHSRWVERDGPRVHAWHLRDLAERTRAYLLSVDPPFSPDSHREWLMAADEYDRRAEALEAHYGLDSAAEE